MLFRSVDDEEVYGVGFKDVGEVLAYDVAAGRTEDVADKKNIHSKILHGSDVEGALSTAIVVVCLGGKQRTVSVGCTGIGSAGREARGNVNFGRDCRHAEGERRHGAPVISAAS